MGHSRTILVLSILLLQCLPKIVTGQSALQIDPEDGFSHLHKGSSKQASKGEYAISQISSGPLDDQTLEWRLPREVIPSHYMVKISPVIDEGQETVGEKWFVPGEVQITVTAAKASSNIVMHSKNVTIHDIRVTQGTNEIDVTNTARGEHDFLNITLGSPLQVGQVYVISIVFTSYITEDLNGLYRSAYVNPDTNETVWIATTQMEATHARQMMPCFDEPALKSIFQFTIGRMDKYLALHNTERLSTEDGPAAGWKYDVFAPTVKQSTYLLALIVSEFTYAEAPKDLLPGKTVRTYAPEHYIRDEGGVYAAENAAKVLNFFGDFFSNEYPLSKMDSAAVPSFFFGAMENYGLNIYRESALLVFPKWTLESERWSISSVIAHELAHQWFGNLVSPAWWTHIWLNEGFATYFASVGSEHTNPEYEPRKRYLNDAVQRSMEAAADPAVAHSVKIDEREWISKWAMDWFDRMAYEQAGSLIRMMEGYLTMPVLKGGLQVYLNRLGYAAAQQDDLFKDLNILGTAAGKLPTNLTIKDIMDTWTLKAGFPLVRVSKASSTKIYVSQEKFTNNVGRVSSGSHVDYDELWHIPVSIATKSSPNFDPQAEAWLDKNTALTTWDANAEEWIILNAGATGYYRVLYDTPLTNLILGQLNSDHQLVDAFTRSQLIDDYFTSAYQQYLSMNTALGFTQYLAGENEMIVWNAVLKHLRKPMNLFSGAGNNFANMRSYLLPRIKGALNITGGLDGNYGERSGMPVLRYQQFLDWACAMLDEDCQNHAVNRVNEWATSGNNTILRDVNQIVYCAAVSKGSDDVFRFIKATYGNTSTTSIQRGYLLNGLGCATDIGLINELLEGSITANYFMTQSHGSTIIQRLAMTPVGRTTVLRFIRENAPKIKTFFGNSNPIASAYTTMAGYVSTNAELQSMETVASEIEATIEDVKDNVKNAMDTVRANIGWMSEFGETFNTFFAGGN